jgi:hypothetical protein
MTPRQVRDLFAVLLMLIGVGGVVTVVFIANRLAGFGLVAAIVAGVGIWLASDR